MFGRVGVVGREWWRASSLGDQAGTWTCTDMRDVTAAEAPNQVICYLYRRRDNTNAIQAFPRRLTAVHLIAFLTIGRIVHFSDIITVLILVIAVYTAIGSIVRQQSA